MNRKLGAVAIGFALPITAQFVDVVRNNTVQANYVNSYSTLPQDQVIQYQFTNPVIKPSAAEISPLAMPVQPYRSQHNVVPKPSVQAAGLPLRARQALETAAADNREVAPATDTSGAPRFTTITVIDSARSNTRKK